MKKRVGILLLCCLALTACKKEVLLQNLDQRQANEVVAALYRHNIDANKQDGGKSGYSVYLDHLDFPAAVNILKVYDLPSDKPMQISNMFPIDSLVASPRAEKARLYSAIEQRLQQSLSTIAGLTSVRVHVSYDVDAGDGAHDARPVHLSVLASYEKDINSQALINDIKRFLKNSFSDVGYDNISVVLSKRDALQHEAPVTWGKANESPWLAWGGWILLLLAGGLAGFWYLARRRKNGNAIPLIE